MTERGSVTTLALAAIGLVMLLGVALAGVAALVSAKAAAQTGADAAALAAAATSHPGFGHPGVRLEADPCREAARIAAANHARLVRCRCSRDGSFRSRVAEVAVVIEVEVPVWGRLSVEATASAEFDPLTALLGP